MLEKHHNGIGEIKFDWWLIVGLMLLNTLLLLALINVKSFWVDELFYVNIAIKSKTLGELLQKASWDSTNGPLYPIIHYYWLKVVGPHEIGIRMLSVFFATCSIPFLYYTIKNLFSRLTAALSITILIVLSRYINHAIEGRAYALSLLLASIVIYLYSSFYSKQWRTITVKEEISYVFSMTLLVLSHYYGIFFIMTLALASIVSYPKKTLILLRPYAITGLLFLFLWGRVLFSAVDTNYTMFSSPSYGIIGTFYHSIFGITNLYAGTVFVSLLVIGSLIARNNKNYSYHSLTLIGFFLVLPFLMAYTISLVKVPIIIGRYFYIFLPMLAVAMALAFEGGWIVIQKLLSNKFYEPSLKIYILVGGLFLSTTFFYKIVYKNDYNQGPEYRGLVSSWQGNRTFDQDTRFFDPVTFDYINIYFARSGDARRAEPLGELNPALSEAAIQQAVAMLRSPYSNYVLPQGDYINAILVNTDLNQLNYDDSEWEIIFDSNKWIWLRRR